MESSDRAGGIPADPATVRQVDEVLARFNQTNDVLDVRRIDPTARITTQHEGLLLELQSRYRDEIELYDAAVSTAIGEFFQLIRFADNAGRLGMSVRTSGDRGGSLHVAGALSLLAGRGS